MIYCVVVWKRCGFLCFEEVEGVGFVDWILGLLARIGYFVSDRGAVKYII